VLQGSKHPALFASAVPVQTMANHRARSMLGSQMYSIELVYIAAKPFDDSAGVSIANNAAAWMVP